jgi:hypothetical protein
MCNFQASSIALVLVQCTSRPSFALVGRKGHERLCYQVLTSHKSESCRMVKQGHCADCFPGHVAELTASKEVSVFGSSGFWVFGFLLHDILADAAAMSSQVHYAATV